MSSKKVAILLSEQTADDIEKILAGMSAQARLLADVLDGAKRVIGGPPPPAPPQPQEPAPPADPA